VGIVGVLTGLDPGPVPCDDAPGYGKETPRRKEALHIEPVYGSREIPPWAGSPGFFF
jgi:hypothetical protein